MQLMDRSFRDETILVRYNSFSCDSRQLLIALLFSTFVFLLFSLFLIYFFVLLFEISFLIFHFFWLHVTFFNIVVLYINKSKENIVY